MYIYIHLWGWIETQRLISTPHLCADKLYGHGLWQLGLVGPPFSENLKTPAVQGHRPSGCHANNTGVSPHQKAAMCAGLRPETGFALPQVWECQGWLVTHLAKSQPNLNSSGLKRLMRSNLLHHKITGAFQVKLVRRWNKNNLKESTWKHVQRHPPAFPASTQTCWQHCEAGSQAHGPWSAEGILLTGAQKLRSSSSSSINFREMFGSWPEASVDSKRSCKAKYDTSCGELWDLWELWGVT